LKALEILLILHDFYEALQWYSHLNTRKRPVTCKRNMPRTMWHSKRSGILNTTQPNNATYHFSYSLPEISNRPLD
jgi:hypothetical protein